MANTNFKVDNGLLVTGGDSLFQANVQVNAHMQVRQTLAVNGDLTVTGNLTFNNTSISGELIPTANGVLLGNSTRTFTVSADNLSLSNSIINSNGTTINIRAGSGIIANSTGISVNASSISNGVLNIGQGGTNAATKEAALSNLLPTQNAAVAGYFLKTDGSSVSWVNGVGFSGSRGFTGSQGIQGFTGSQGIIGFTGSQGTQGFTGSAGTNGFWGSVGFTGSQGAIGFTGSAGTNGFWGSQGPIGFSGSVGFTGSRGEVGFTGSQGIQGFTGSQGIQGPIGFTGSTGPAGGSNTQVIFNDSNAANGSANFTFNKATNTLAVSGPLSSGNTTVTGFANVTTTLAAGNTTVTGFANVTSTLAAGNTTITGFANVSTTLQVGGISSFSANLSVANNYVLNPTFQSYKEQVNSLTISTTTQTLDLSLTNIFNLTMANSATLTFSNPPTSGIAYTLTLYCKQDATGNRSITWPASVKWPNASAPTMSTGANKIDIFSFFTVDGGTTYVGALALANVG